ncbi:hypothetical protein GCM10027446_28600 [Angustibacter peucedani]
MTFLEQHACQALCAWRRDPTSPDGALPRFRCEGCGSQWDRGQGWTPADRDGTVSPDVRAELQTG